MPFWALGFQRQKSGTNSSPCESHVLVGEAKNKQRNKYKFQADMYFREKQNRMRGLDGRLLKKMFLERQRERECT